MVDWHHQLTEHEFEHAQGDGEGQRSQVCCSPWGLKESHMTKRLNNNKESQKPAVAHLETGGVVGALGAADLGHTAGGISPL